MKEVAALLGVSKQRLAQPLEVYPDFPEPAVVISPGLSGTGPTSSTGSHLTPIGEWGDLGRQSLGVVAFGGVDWTVNWAVLALGASGTNPTPA